MQRKGKARKEKKICLRKCKTSHPLSYEHEYLQLYYSTCLNLIVAFSVAMKHRLRFEPYMDYEDMQGYLEYLDTFAKEANKGVDLTEPKDSVFIKVSDFLGMPWAEKNPRANLKNAQKPVGNLPLEILSYISGYLDSIIDNGTFKTPIFHVQGCGYTYWH